MPDSMRSRLLGRSGLRVSELCLGTMTFGTEWGFGAGKAICREIYAAFREAGGTILDTADVYNDGASERIVGRIAAAERDAVVLGTKFTLPTDRNDPNSGGSHRKGLRRSVEESLRRLAADHVTCCGCTPGTSAPPPRRPCGPSTTSYAPGRCRPSG
ncbi:aldo/keto reductase [Streptomyces mirabilis]|uniref:aldo/keto reductase n=1 Tax=Streptomyces mirabilis TaxID=68239 RepID=UPI0036A63447